MSGRSTPNPNLRQLAARGSVIVGLRGLAARIIALAGTIVLARTLSAAEFGIFAVGASLIISLGYVMHAGVGAGLIRRTSEPTRVELETMVAVNGGLMIGVVVITTSVCVAIGGQAIAIALMVAAMPVTAFRGPGLVAFERKLSFRRLALVEVFETTALYGMSAVLVIMGFGLYGICLAAAVRAVGGTLLMLHAAPCERVRPRIAPRVIKELIGFASRYQAVALVNFIRDQGVNLGIAAIGGLTTLATYAVASHVLQAPQIFFEALFRIAYPAMARLSEYGEDARNVLQRTAKAVAMGTGLIVAPLSAASPLLIPTIFGSRWSDAAVVILPASAGLMIGAPVAVAAAGYLFAQNQPEIVLRSAVLHTLAWFAVALPLLIPFGVIAAGLGTLAASVVEALVLGMAVRRRTGADVLGVLAIPLLAAGAAAAAGLAIVSLMSMQAAVGAMVAACATASVYVIIVLIFQRPAVIGLARLVRNAHRVASH